MLQIDNNKNKRSIPKSSMRETKYHPTQFPSISSSLQVSRASTKSQISKPSIHHHKEINSKQKIDSK